MNEKDLVIIDVIEQSKLAPITIPNEFVIFLVN